MGVDGWKGRAACLSDPGSHWDGDLLPSTFAMCMGCPVRDDCLMEALDHDERSDCGVWGGTTDSGRRQIRRGADPYQVWDASRREFAQQRLAA